MRFSCLIRSRCQNNFYFAASKQTQTGNYMKKLLILLLFVTQFALSQENNKTQSYKFGHDGMELIARSKKGTVIISTFNSKMNIRQEIAHKVYNMYLADKITTEKTITVNGADAKVTGKCIVRKRKNLIVVDFYYETVQWNSGLTEIYKKNLG